MELRAEVEPLTEDSAAADTAPSTLGLPRSSSPVAVAVAVNGSSAGQAGGRMAWAGPGTIAMTVVSAVVAVVVVVRHPLAALVVLLLLLLQVQRGGQTVVHLLVEQVARPLAQWAAMAAAGAGSAVVVVVVVVASTIGAVVAERARLTLTRHKLPA